MADVSIDGTISTSTARGCRGLVFVNSTKGYFFYIDSGGTFVYSKTTDGGATWGAAVTINSATTQVAYDVWFDQWTPGDFGTLIHCWYFDTTNDKLFWRSLDTTSDTLGTERTCFTGASAVAGNNTYVSGTKAVSGYLYACTAIDASNEQYFGRSTDGGTTWGAALSATFQEANPDHALLFPASGTGDNNDIWAIYHDSSATALTMKMWDSSAAAQVESSTVQTIIAVGTDITLYQYPYSGSIRLSDGALILVSCSDRDTATSDMQCWVVTGVTAASLTGITAKTDITTNIDDNYHPQTFIDQSTNNIYVAYNGKRDGTETLGTTTKVYYTKSTDGGTTWTSGDTAYMEGAAGVVVQTWSSISGTRFYVAWRVAGTSLGNKVSSLTFPFVYRPTGALPFVGTPAKQTSRTLTASLATSSSGIGTQTDTDSFDRANADPLAGNWTSSGASGSHFKILSNSVTTSDLAQDSWAIWNTWSHGDDHYSQAEVTVVGAGAQTGFGVYARHSSTAATNTGYRIVINDAGTIDFLKFVAGVTSQNTTRSVTYIAGTKLGLSVTGGATTTLKIWYGGAQQGADITDSSSPITTGVPAIGFSSTSTSGSVDNWDAGTVSVGSSPGLSGSLVKAPAKSLTGVLSFVGSITRKTFKALSGTFSFISNFRYPARFTAILSFTGNTAKKTLRTLDAAAISFIGTNTRRFAFARSLFAANLFFNAFDGSKISDNFRSLLAGGATAAAQCFVGRAGVLTGVKFRIRRSGSPTGNITSNLYAMTGILGSTGQPTGTALATADTVLDSAIQSTSFGYVTFSYSGVTPFTLVDGTNYCISIEYSGGDASNRIDVDDGGGSFHPGNESAFTGSWSPSPTRDMVFYISVGNSFVKSTLKSLSGVLSFVGSITKKSLKSFFSSLGCNYLASYFDSSLTGVDFENTVRHYAECFHCNTGVDIDRISVILSKSGTPTGNVTCSIYDRDIGTGTYGVDAIPLNPALAATDPIAATSLSTTPAITIFTFGTKYTLQANKDYFVSVDYANANSFNWISIYTDAGVAPTGERYGGNFASANTSQIWTSSSATGDMYFGVSVANPLTKRLNRLLSATLNFAGSITKTSLKALTVALSFIGSLATQYISGGQLFLQSLAGTLSFIGSQSKSTLKSLSGALSFIGSVFKFVTHTLSGTLSFIGSTTKKMLRSISGALSFIGSLTTSELNVLLLTATLSLVGAVSKSTGKSLTGLLSFIGTLSKFSSRLLTAALSFSGSLTKKALKSLSGALSFIGTTANSIRKSLTGAMSFAGSIARTYIFSRTSLTASLPFVGSISKQARKSFSGALSFIGSLAKKTLYLLTATLDFIGDLATLLDHAGAHFISFASNLDFVGNLNKFTARFITASLFFSGSISRVMALAATTFTASLSFIVVASKSTRRSVAGMLSFIGSLTTSEMILMVLSASLNFVGNATKRTGKSLSGALGLIGDISRTIVHTLSGTLSLIGSVYRAFPVHLESTLSFIGSFTGGLVSHVFYVLVESALLMAGGINRSIFRPFIAYLLISGELNKFTSKILDGVLSFVHRLFKLASFNKIVDTQLLKPPLFTAQAIKSPITISATVLKRTGIQAF